MKKVMIGILILIPIIILLVVAMVSTIVSAQAHVAVENIELKYKNSESTIYELSLTLEEVANKTINLKDYLDVVVYPQKANNYTIEWTISGDVTYTDEEYYDLYKKYLEDPDSYERVYPAAAFVDEGGREVTSNTSGDLMIGSYCTFTVRVVAENVSKILSVKVVGYDVKRVELRAQSGNGTLEVGESVRLLASYTPIDSIVSKTEWTSSDPAVATVDKNGVVTAKSQGVATITHGASVYSTGENVEGAFEVTVNSNGASTRYGLTIVTSKSTLTLSEIGVSADAVAKDGCTISEGKITLTKSVASISVGGKTLVIEKCDPDDIEIQNRSFYENKEDGYVLAVGEQTLSLNVIWADMTNEIAIEGAQWSSNDESVATVDSRGNVKGVSSGIATITVTLNGKSARIVINVQTKLASVQLRTSDASLAVGLARETVFASQRFENPTAVRSDSTLIPNRVSIIVQGEKEGATEEELALFYSAYRFEIIEGGEYAFFDENNHNQLVFKDGALEGKGKQRIVVRVSAKYPKYEGLSKFTTQEVTINAIYGVAVSSVDEIEVAAQMQKAYVKERAKDGSVLFEIKNENNGNTYKSLTDQYSDSTYAICFEDNIGYTIAEQGEHLVGPQDRLTFYGDVYGNNHMLSTESNQLDRTQKLMRISWSNVTMSNLVMRLNSPIDDKEISSAKDTQVFTGIVGIIGSGDDWMKYRLENVRVEYCILENAREVINVDNSDVTFDGCVVRNIAYAAIVTQVKFYSREDEEGIYYPVYSHIAMNNFVFSNTLGSIMIIKHENFTMDGENYRFVDGNKKDDESGELAAANEKWYLDNLYSKGAHFTLDQTGFLDAYNWQPISSAELFSVGKVGNVNVDDLIKNVSDSVARSNSFFKDRCVIDKDDVCWIHIAFACIGITSGFNVEKTYPQINLQDKRFSYANTGDIKIESKSMLGRVGESFLQQANAGIWGYDNTQNIQPTTQYIINDAFIDRLHSR